MLAFFLKNLCEPEKKKLKGLIFDVLLPAFDSILPAFDSILPVFDSILPTFDSILPAFDSMLIKKLKKIWNNFHGKTTILNNFASDFA